MDQLNQSNTAVANIPVDLVTSNRVKSERDPVEVLPWLPCELRVAVPVSRFTVRDLLALRPGAIVETDFSESSGLPLECNGEVLAKGELDVVDSALAIRITELS